MNEKINAEDVPSAENMQEQQIEKEIKLFQEFIKAENEEKKIMRDLENVYEEYKDSSEINSKEKEDLIDLLEQAVDKTNKVYEEWRKTVKENKTKY